MSGSISRREAYEQLRLNLQAAERKLKSTGGEPDAKTTKELTDTKVIISSCIATLQEKRQNEQSNLWVKFWENRKIKQAERMETKLQKAIDEYSPELRQADHRKQVVKELERYRNDKKRELETEMKKIENPSHKIIKLKNNLDAYINKIKLPEPVQPGEHKVDLNAYEIHEIINNQTQIESLLTQLKTTIERENSPPLPAIPVVSHQEPANMFNPRQVLNEIKERLFEARTNVFQATFEHRQGPGMSVYRELTEKLRDLEEGIPKTLEEGIPKTTEDEMLEFQKEVEDTIFNFKEAMQALSKMKVDLQAIKPLAHALRDDRARNDIISKLTDLSMEMDSRENFSMEKISELQKRVVSLGKEIMDAEVASKLQRGEKKLEKAIDLLQTYGSYDPKKAQPEKSRAAYRQLFAKIPELNEALATAKKERTLYQVTQFNHSLADFYNQIKEAIGEEAYLQEMETIHVQEQLEANTLHLHFLEDSLRALHVDQSKKLLTKTNLKLDRLNKEIEFMRIELEIFEAIKMEDPSVSVRLLEVYREREIPQFEAISKKMSELYELKSDPEFDEEYKKFQVHFRERIELKDALEEKKATLEEAVRNLEKEAEEINAEIERLKKTLK